MQFLQYAFLDFLRVYSILPHIETPKFLLAIFIHLSFSTFAFVCIISRP
nr:MAG TPA: hypothetical protein [Caudoviricetes sp.]